MEHMSENHQHETTAATAPGAVMLGFAGSTQPTALMNIVVFESNTTKGMKRISMYLTEKATKKLSVLAHPKKQ